MTKYDIAIIGGGCIGLSVAKHLTEKTNSDICILEKEYHLAQHQSGRNSGVLHPGFNYKPETKKAKFATEGTKRMKKYCRENDVPCEEYGIMVVATDESEYEHLELLRERAKANGVTTEILESESEIKEKEPHTTGEKALYSPEAASVDHQKYIYTISKDVENRGVDMFLGHEVENVELQNSSYRIETTNGVLNSDYIVNASGLNSDKIAHSVGIGREYQVIPFRGIYYELVPEKQDLIKSMIYPTPDPDYHFLGVHYTRRTDDKVLVGPNAAIAFGREAYDNSSVNVRQVLEMITFSGFWRMMQSKTMLRAAWRELNQTYRKKEFVKASQELLPAITPSDITKSYTGIRAQVVHRDGTLVNDPIIAANSRSVHVLNAVSPGFTSSLPFGEHVADILIDRL